MIFHNSRDNHLVETIAMCVEIFLVFQMSAEEVMVEVRQKLQDTLLKGLGKAEEYGLFLANKEDPKKGVWLDRQKSLSYYMLENRVRNIFEPTHNGFQ